MKTLSYTEIPYAERSDIGKTCIMAPWCNPLAIEDTIEKCLETCISCGMEARDENGDPRPMTLADCEDIAWLVTE